MTDNVSKIKDRLSVVDIVSGYLKIQKAGVNFKAPCPFHNEKTPSFFVSPERQMWKCFGCGKGGSIFDFIMEIEGVEFPEALRILAARAGIELEEFDSTIKDSKEQLYQICETSARFFEKQLSGSNIGKHVLEYLKERGLKDETIAQFRLGFAPNTWDSLSTYLRSSGYTEKDIVDTGLIIKKQPTTNNQQPTTGVYDRFRSRIMFPIADVNGRVVGFTGRIFEDENPTNDKQLTTNDKKSSVVSRQSSIEVAKYINTPQTLIYDKSRILYGLNHSRGDIRKSNKCLLVEGNMDAVMSYQAGVKNVVASSGTALTPMHLGILKRYTTNLDFCFDNDSAGTLATKRGIGMALAQDFNVKAVSIDDPEGQANGAGKECKDPADYVKKYGQGWEKVASSAKPVVEFYFDKAKENYDPNSAESKKNLILIVAPFIKRLSSKVEKSHWINQLAFFLRAKEDAVESDIVSAPDDLSVYENPVPQPHFSQKSGAGLASKIEALDVLNEALLSLVIKDPKLFKEELVAADWRFLSPLASEIIVQLAKEDFNKFDFGNFTKKFEPDKLLDLEFIYLKSQALWEGFKDDDLRAEFTGIFNKLKQKTINSGLSDLGYEIRSAEAAKDKTRIANLVDQFNQLTRELAETHKI